MHLPIQGSLTGPECRTGLSQKDNGTATHLARSSSKSLLPCARNALTLAWMRIGVGCSPMQQTEKGSAWHELSDNAEVGRQGAGAHEQDDIGMLEPLHD